MPEPVLQVAVPGPFGEALDYLPPHDTLVTVRPGARVQVPLGKRIVVGMVVAISSESALPPGRLRRARRLLDAEPLVSEELMALAGWASRYYHHPLGEVYSTLLPTLLRQGRDAHIAEVRSWQITPLGQAVDPHALARAPRQAYILRLLAGRREGASEAELRRAGVEGTTLRALAAKGWIAVHQPAAQGTGAKRRVELNAEQQHAARTLSGAMGGYGAFLLEGVTGSGKTEVYLEAIADAIGRGTQALVLVPEIGLTPQLIERLGRALEAPVIALHSGLADGERAQAWLKASRGLAPVIVGTRSAVFTPLARPGLIVLDEEHDASFKQQDGFRYHARDLAVWRAQHLGIPVVLGSATPSLESLHNAARGRYVRLELQRRAAGAQPPRLGVLDLRKQPMTGGLSGALINTMRRHLEAGHQVLLFLNRRGFAPTLTCHECGWVAECARCDANLTYHKSGEKLRCHHCGAECSMPRQCGKCHSEALIVVGHGTERVEQTLSSRFPEYHIARIDRDSTRRKGELERVLSEAQHGHSRILIGTQMLAKGHHFPRVTLVGILNVDGALYSADFRTGERLAQLVIQVAGRAGRAEQPGEVVLQTHHPDHPLLRILIDQGYRAFAEFALAERRATQLPPYAHLALLRAEAGPAETPLAWLESARVAGAPLPAGIELWGPVPAPMEKRAGRYRAQLLVHALARSTLHAFLDEWMPKLAALPAARKVRWSVDVDPLEMF